MWSLGQSSQHLGAAEPIDQAFPSRSALIPEGDQQGQRHR